MIRIVIENLLLLLLPTLLYVAYIYLTAGKKGTKQNVLDDAPLIWLFLAGVGLAVSVLLVFGTFSGGKPGQSYRPPEFRDGTIVPGQLDKRQVPADG
jgi:uncharacterized protein DUF6111